LNDIPISSNLNFFEKSRLAGGERHPTPETGLSHIPAKNDKRKTARAVTPLRFRESLFLLCRDLASTFEVQSTHAVARIFLTGYPPILGMVYVSRSCYLKAKKSLQTQTGLGGLNYFHLGVKIQPTKTLFFFIWWACPTYDIKGRADKL